MIENLFAWIGWFYFRLIQDLEKIWKEFLVTNTRHAMTPLVFFCA